MEMPEVFQQLQDLRILFMLRVVQEVEEISLVEALPVDLEEQLQILVELQGLLEELEEQEQQVLLMMMELRLVLVPVVREQMAVVLVVHQWEPF